MGREMGACHHSNAATVVVDGIGREEGCRLICIQALRVSSEGVWKKELMLSADEYNDEGFFSLYHHIQFIVVVFSLSAPTSRKRHI